MKIEGFDGKFGSPAPETRGTAPRTVAAGSVPVSEQVRPSASFKIKDSLRQFTEEQPVVKSEVVTEKQERTGEREAVTLEKVQTALEKYIRDHQPEPTIALALKTHRPEIQGETITLAVDNQLQLEKMEALKLHLQHVLMKQLRNGYLSLDFKLFDAAVAPEEKRLFTASEKFEHFVEINPVIAELKRKFGLELE